MSAAVGLEVETATNIRRLHEISHLWRPHARTPFHTPEWLLTWWHHFGSGQLHSLLLWDRGSLAGVVPCFRHAWQGAQQLTLLGSGISDYLDPWVPAELAGLVVEHLQQADWEVCNWQDLSAESPFLDSSLWSDASVTITSDPPVSAISLGGPSFEDYWQHRSKDLRRNLRRYRDRAEQSGPLQFRVSDCAEHHLIDTLIRLHGDRWQKRGELGMVEQNHSAAFLHDVSQRFAAGSRCSLRLFELRWKGEIVAVILGFAWRQRLYSYLSAFLPEYEVLGFGRTLLYESLRAVWREGFTAWEFLRGEEPYKKSWGAVFQPRSRLIARRS
jgi:CelD/BcsL family acetyltransferase involved in cellulose biosynthesis